MNVKNEVRIARIATLVKADSEALLKRISNDIRELGIQAAGTVDCTTPNKDNLVTFKQSAGSVKKVKETHALRLVAISNRLAELEELGFTVTAGELIGELSKTETYATGAADWLVAKRKARDEMGDEESVEESA